MSAHLVVSTSAVVRLEAARVRLAALAPAAPALVVGATRAAADDLAVSVALARGATFGLARASLHELAVRLALPALARDGLSPTGALGVEAVAARAAFHARTEGQLRYFGPVAALPGFPHAAARTIAELELAGVSPEALPALGDPGARPGGRGPDRTTVRPGAYTRVDAVTGEPFTVAWWDPLALDRGREEGGGLRHPDLITKEAPADLVAAGRAAYERWRAQRAAAAAAGARPSMAVWSATEWARAGEPAPADRDGTAVEIAGAGAAGLRPSGPRFGTLVHALLAAVPLDAPPADVAGLAALHARLLGATDEERAAAAALVRDALRHPIVAAAREARAAGRGVRREAPVSIVLPPADAPPGGRTPEGGVPGAALRVVDGQVDLAFEQPDGSWLVVDFKTDAELGGSEPVYRRQVALYAAAIARATGRPARGVVLRI